MKVKTFLTFSLNAMAQAIFSSLILGIILKQFGEIFNLFFLLNLAKLLILFCPLLIGISIANSFKLSLKLSLLNGIGSFITAHSAFIFYGSSLDQINSANILAAYIFVCLGIIVIQKFKINSDLLIVPIIYLFLALAFAFLLSPIILWLLNQLNNFIVLLTNLQPLIMVALISMLMGIILTLPISSAAIAIILNFSGIVAGASTIGCCAHMIGFAIVSYRDNDLKTSIAQGLGTSMIQISNILRKPIIVMPMVISSIISAIINYLFFGLINNSYGAGMGSSALIGQIMTINTMTDQNLYYLLVKIGFAQFLIPGLIAWIVYRLMKKNHLIQDGDYTIAK